MAALTGCAVVGGSTVALLPAASASSAVSVTGTTVTSALAGDTVRLKGMRIANTSGVQQVTLSTSRGTVTLPSHTGLTTAYGYNFGPASEIVVSGSQTDVNKALAAATYTAATDNAASAVIKLGTAPYAAGYAFLAPNGHYYKYVSSPHISWTAAQTAAAASTFKGMTGYLAQVPNDVVNNFIAGKIQGASNVWLGGKATNGVASRDWTWQGGPLNGHGFTHCSNLTTSCIHAGDGAEYKAWATGEPNNSGGTESYLVTNLNGVAGQWNDFADSTTNAGGYVIEYGNNAYGSTTNRLASIADASSTVRTVAHPARITAALTSTDSVAVTWRAAVPITSTVDHYKVVANPGTASCTTSGLSCTITGLRAGKTYSVYVLAYTSANAKISTSQRVIVRTTPAVLIAPRTVRRGGTLTISANGFAANSTVTVSLGSTTLKTLTLDATGSLVNVKVTVPKSFAVGGTKVYIAGTSPSGGAVKRSDVIIVKR